AYRPQTAFSHTPRCAHLSGGTNRQEERLAVLRGADLRQCLDIFLRDEIVDRLHVTGGNGFGYHLRGTRFRFGGTLTRLRIEERRLALALGAQDLALLQAFRLENRRLAQTFRLKDGGTLLTLGFHLAGHRLDQIRRRRNILDLDTGDFYAPRIGGVIDDAQQALIDFVTLAEHLVQVQRTKHGTDIGHRQVADRQLQVVDLIRRLGGIDHLEETHRIDGYHGIVFRDDFLRRNIQHRFHHVDLATDGVDKRHNDAQARLKAMGITTKTLHRVLVTLRHTLDAHDNHEHYKYRERSGNNRPSHLLTLRI